MTEWAIAGDPHTTLPDGLEAPMPFDGRYVVVPWRCPVCEHVVAETVVESSVRARTLLRYSPIRMADADDGPIPFYGPGRRLLRGKGPRRAADRLASGAFDAMRARTRVAYDAQDPLRQKDHSAVELLLFDALCTECPRRLRIDLRT